MRMRLLTTWLLILAVHTATGQMEVPAASASPDSKTVPALRTLLTAKTVLVVGEPSVLYPTSKAEQAFKKALMKWRRFQLVDDAETADLIIVVSQYSSSKPYAMERISESVSIFVGGSMSNVDATPLWAIKELGPELGQRPTGKLVEHFRKYVTELEESLTASSASSPI